MVSVDIRRAQLSRLAEALRDLVGVLTLDPSCSWTSHFQHCLALSETLLNDGFTQEQLADLSVSITRCYGGSGSFSDYTPGDYDTSTARYSEIPGTEIFETFAKLTYERAIALRVVDQY